MTETAAPSGDRPAGGPPAVSIVIPTWRRAGLIRAAVDSVLRQTFADFELIVVDDGSGDGTPEVLAAVPDPRLRVIVHEVNRGGNAARNTGARAARADWIAFQDSDDEWLPEKLARQIARLAEPGPGGAPWVGVYCGLAATDRDARGRLTLSYVPRPGDDPIEGDLATALLPGNFVSTQTLVARRAALEAAGWFDEALPALQDWDMALRLARLGPIAVVDEPLVIQKLSADSVTRATGKRLAAYARVLEKNAGRFPRPLLARHCRAIALGHARRGERRAALTWGARALGLDPLAPLWGARLARALVSAPAPDLSRP